MRMMGVVTTTMMMVTFGCGGGQGEVAEPEPGAGEAEVESGEDTAVATTTEVSEAGGSTDPGALFDTIVAGDVGAVKGLLETNPALKDARDEYGIPPLHMAVFHGQVEIVQLLIKVGADLEALDGAQQFSNTALGAAVFSNQPEMVQMLVDAGAKTDVKNWSHAWTPVIMAVQFGFKEILTILADGGADLDIDMNGKVVPLHEAATRGDLEMVKLLLQKNADPEKADGWGNTVVHAAAMTDNLEVLKYLVETAEFDPKGVSEHSPTPLVRALQKGMPNTAKYLIEKTKVKGGDYAGGGKTYCEVAMGKKKVLDLFGKDCSKTPSNFDEVLAAGIDPSLVSGALGGAPENTSGPIAQADTGVPQALFQIVSKEFIPEAKTAAEACVEKSKSGPTWLHLVVRMETDRTFGSVTVAATNAPHSCPKQLLKTRC